MPATTRDSLALDDLEVGAQYEFITPRGHVYRGRWVGMDGHHAWIDCPPGTFDLYPAGVIIGRKTRWFAACKITAMEPCPVCDLSGATCTITPIAETEEAMDGKDGQPVPWRFWLLFGSLVGIACAAWALLFLHVFGR